MRCCKHPSNLQTWLVVASENQLTDSPGQDDSTTLKHIYFDERHYSVNFGSCIGFANVTRYFEQL